MVLEESPDTFFERFSQYATQLDLLPVPEGWPLLEAHTPLGLIFLFDRGTPPAPLGPTDVLVHGVVREVRPAEGKPRLTPRTGGAYTISGRVIGEPAPGFFLFDAGFPILLASQTPLEPETRIEVDLEPPLMAFRK